MTSRSLRTAVRTSRSAVVSCTAAPAGCAVSSSGSTSWRGVNATGTPISALIGEGIRDSLVPAVSSIRVRRRMARPATPGTNQLGSGPYGGQRVVASPASTPAPVAAIPVARSRPVIRRP
ncbi:hypothetical protein [Streptomyces sp. NPDC014995]|uniref:hypothetical protein n=1 Tax=Streptomyces sp. NPDC014995 TaxID=3364936 RepID=UPI0036FF0242